ncbi:nucleotidyltransferase [miscellaneous Crenarchaeota group archaeon SMTZ1-55]|nr:MAG: nucleotidyltransferase [miscellaneous Crenarchaeota group archaeon SMTZ1-55]
MNYQPESLRVIIPVGGIAKRLHPLTAEVSKACVRLLNRPLIEISLLTLARQNIKNFIFGVKGYTNYKSLHDHFESGIGFSSKYHITPRVHIKYQPNVADYGSADSARINMEYYDVKDPVFAVQGDNIFDIDLQNILAFHQENGAFMTIGLMTVADVEGYGIADIAKDMRISRFVEKPPPKNAPSQLANTGLYLLSPEIRAVFRERRLQEMLRTHNRLDFGYDLIPYLVETGRPIYGYILKGAWYDVGTPERYLEAMKGILHGQLKSLQDFGGSVYEDSSIWIQGESTESIQRRREIVRKVRDGKIELEGAVLIGRHCQIGDGVKIVDSCIDNYSRIEENVVIEGSAVMDRTIIGRNTEIRDSIIGRHATINSTSAKATRLQNSVVGDNVTLGEGCQLIMAKVYPHKHVPKESLIENYSIT